MLPLGGVVWSCSHAHAHSLCGEAFLATPRCRLTSQLDLDNRKDGPHETTGRCDHHRLCLQATFPSGSTLFANSTPAYKKEWEKQPPAWAHPDSVARRQDKIDLLAAGDNRYWKVIPEDPTPKCPRSAPAGPSLHMGLVFRPLQ